MPRTRIRYAGDDRMRRTDTAVEPLIAQLMARRIELKLTRSALARKIPMDRPALFRLETGATKPQLATFTRWARALGLRPVLLNGADAPVAHGAIDGARP
jgi:transcriptional regulator with XRE-family HTH domain